MLAFLVFGVVVLKEAHHLLAHDHEEHLHCLATGDEIHFHSADYLPTNCFVCFFNFSPSEKIISDLSIKEVVQQPHVAQFFYTNQLSLFTYLDLRLRGPPVFNSKSVRHIDIKI